MHSNTKKVELLERLENIPIYQTKGPVFELLDEVIPKFPNEAIYIYSIREKKIVYSHGWKDVLGYEDWEMTPKFCLSLIDPQFTTCYYDFVEKSILFLTSPKEHITEYGFTFEIRKIHKNGSIIPLIHSVGVYKTENNEVTEIVIRSQINYSIKFGKVMRYTINGPEKDKFMAIIENAFIDAPALSEKEKQVLQLVANGLTYKEIAAELGVSISAIEKRILPLFKKFNVKSITHLVHFAHENYLID